MTDDTPMPTTGAQIDEGDTCMPTADKGKGKAPAEPAQDQEMASEDSSSSDDEADNDADIEEADEDNMEEIETDNIVSSRTRGREIDFARAAKELDGQGDAAGDNDDEDDEDFVGDDEDMDMRD